MKFTLSWLKDYLDTTATADEIADALNRTGLEVEGVENPADALRPFVIVDVLEAEQHPDADKLRVCNVTDGSDQFQIVCGAPNARAGMKAVLGKAGTYVPGADFTLKTGKIRGVESQGMMCSARELNQGEDHDGILDLPADAPVGQSYADYLNLDDPVIEVAITPNRQECLGIYGIARDLAAAGVGTLKNLAIPTITENGTSPVAVSIADDTARDCPAFLGRAFSGVKNGPSPDWLQNRLKAIGLRPISALVDITNYISYAHGRPLHVYDISKLSGDIVVRRATAGEEFAALDDNSYTAKGGETAITDNSGLIGFGGIVGGETTGCDDNTTDVFLELAYFDPIAIANTGRAHQINTDARYRFERGVDTGFMMDGMAIASQMILDLCGGTASDLIVAGDVPAFDKTVQFRPARVASLGGMDVAAAQSIDILSRLGFTVSGSGDTVDVAVPSWRVDVDGEADLVEEVLRIVGLDALPAVPLPPRGGHHQLTDGQKRERALRRALAGAGLHDTVTWSFMDQKYVSLFGAVKPELELDNPIASNLNHLRPSILPNLLEAASRNQARGQDGIALMEVGPIYHGDGERDQETVATGIRAGKSRRHWQQAAAEVTVFDAKADAIAGLEAIGAPVASLQVSDQAADYFHPYRKGSLRLGKNVLAEFGELHPNVLRTLDVAGPVVGCVIHPEKVPAKRKKGPSKGALQLSNLQSVTRDFAFTMAADKTVGPLVKAVEGADKKHIRGVDVFDVYQGPGVAEGEKSVALCVYLTPAEATFTDAGLEEIATKIIAAAEKAVGAKLRA